MKNKFSGWTAAALVVANMVGTGVFTSLGFQVVSLSSGLAVILLWILGASLSTSREIFSGSVFKFETGLHFENYVSAWKTQNVSVFFGNSLLYAVISCSVIMVSPGRPFCKSVDRQANFYMRTKRFRYD